MFLSQIFTSSVLKTFYTFIFSLFFLHCVKQYNKFNLNILIYKTVNQLLVLFLKSAREANGPPRIEKNIDLQPDCKFKFVRCLEISIRAMNRLWRELFSKGPKIILITGSQKIILITVSIFGSLLCSIKIQKGPFTLLEIYNTKKMS